MKQWGLELEKSLCKYQKLYFYGAGVIAFGAYKAIREFFHIAVEGFLVTRETGQVDKIEEIPIIPIGKAKIDKTQCLIVLAAPEVYHEEMEQTLKLCNYHNYVKMDAQMEYALMGSYLKRVRNLHLIEEYPIEIQPVNDYTCEIYMAVSHRDVKLRGIYKDKPWIKRIQVGATLTTERIACITDEGKDSLSEENELYGELTATYYVWKHNRHAITGLFHYRRILDVTEEQLKLLGTQRVDVILPLPFVCTPDASGQYKRYLLPEDIEIMLEVLKEKESEHFAEIYNILQTPYLYNYNILIARKEVFDDYCSWLFPILKEITYRCEKIKRNRLPRYIGRIGEVLTSVYFMQNENYLRIAHAKKIWRV